MSSSSPRRRSLFVASLVALVLGTVAPLLPAAPASAAPASLASHSFLYKNPDGSPVRWNPCQTIDYVTNLAGGPSWAHAELKEGIAMIEVATGLRFRWVGHTNEALKGGRPVRVARYGLGPAPVLIGFATEAQLPFKQKSASGWGQPAAEWDLLGGQLRYMSGILAVRPNHGWTRGIASANPLSLFFAHELGHLVGLGHASTHDEVMGTGGNGSQRTWGLGDRRGFHQVGAAQGCIGNGILPTVTNLLRDVVSGTFFDDAVDWLVSTGITTGCAVGRFCPERSVTRAEMATFLWRANGSPSAGRSGFSDVSDRSYYSEAVAWLSSMGITTGCAPGRYCPDSPVTRDQMATFLWRASGSAGAGTSTGFGDVPRSTYFAPAVAWLVRTDLTTGCSANRYCPAQPVTRAQMATFLHRAATG